MSDVVVCVPKSFGLETWIAEGDAADTPWSGREWDFYLGSVRQRYPMRTRRSTMPLCEHNDDTITCHTCGAVVDDDARAAQADSGGGPMLTQWYCRAHLVAGLRKLQAEIRAQKAECEPQPATCWCRRFGDCTRDPRSSVLAALHQPACTCACHDDEKAEP